MAEINEKYKMSHLKSLSNESRIYKIGIMIANELHNIHSVLDEIKQKKL